MGCFGAFIKAGVRCTACNNRILGCPDVLALMQNVQYCVIAHTLVGWCAARMAPCLLNNRDCSSSQQNSTKGDLSRFMLSWLQRRGSMLALPDSQIEHVGVQQVHAAYPMPSLARDHLQQTLALNNPMKHCP